MESYFSNLINIDSKKSKKELEPRAIPLLARAALDMIPGSSNLPHDEWISVYDKTMDDMMNSNVD
jgi:hypothetical protein